jgi:glycosyltransferase involved in cell wall biosynthesis
MAMNNLTQGLIREGHTVKVLAINTKKHFTQIEQLPADYRAATSIEAVFVDTEVKAVDAFLNLFSGASYNISRFYSAAFEQKLIEVLQTEQFDIVQLESLYVSMYAATIRKHSKANVVLRAHNIEHQIWEQEAKQCKNSLKKAYLDLLARRLKKYELKSLEYFDAIAPITQTDAEWFRKNGFGKPMVTIPFGISIGEAAPGLRQSSPKGSFGQTGTRTRGLDNNDIEEYPSVFHIGAMDWQPNIEGLQWFLSKVWPKVSAKHPELKLFLAGRNMQEEQWRQYSSPNVILVGEVDNAQEFILSKGLMIVPLLSGGGMRVKLIEGMALGKTIVTTRIGAEGVEGVNNKDFIVVNSADAFAEAISQCITDKQLYATIGENARIMAEKHYNNEAICKALVKFYQQLLPRVHYS